VLGAGWVDHATLVGVGGLKKIFADANTAIYRLAPAVARSCGLLPSLAVAVQPVPADSRKLATAARCVGFGCAIPCRLLGVVVVAGNGNIPHGSHPRSGRDDSPLPPLSRLRRSARRAAGAIADDGQGLFPETPQGFFLKIDLYRLLSYLTFQQGDVLGIQSRVRASSLARKDRKST